MPTYFKPLRRKAGVATLVIACIFVASWIRSRTVLDWISTNRLAGNIHDISCVLGEIEWSSWDREVHRYAPTIGGLDQAWTWYSIPNPYPADYHHPGIWFMRTPVESNMGPDMSRLQSEGLWGPNIIAHGVSVKIAHATIVIPMTLLSAWLLISKPRATKSVN